MRIALVAVGLGVLGCGCGLAPLTFSTKAAPLTAAPAQGPAVSRLRMVVDRIRLESAGEGQAAGTESDWEATGGPFLLDLSGGALDGVVTEAFLVHVSSATQFDGVKIRIHSLGAAEAPAGSALAEMGQSSIIIDGMSGGAAFTFRSSLDEDQERRTPVLAAKDANVDLSFDTSRWFSDGAGGALDPTVAANQSAIEDNIKSSLEAFEDDDHDGTDDASEGTR